MKKKILSVSFYAMFICYIFLMLLLFFRVDSLGDIKIFGPRSVNLIPFYTIWEYLSGANKVSSSLALNNVLGNIIVFIPYGLYIQILRKDKRFNISFLQVAITSFAIEIIQFTFNLGSADVDDLILNCIGGLIGIFMYKLLLKAVKEEDKAKMIVTAFSLLVGVPIISIAIIIFVYNGVRFKIHP